MSQKKNKKEYTKEDATYTLDSVNEWIENCDTKTAIIMGIYGVIITIILSTDWLKEMIAILETVVSNMSFWNILYLSFFTIAILVIVLGMLKFILVLIPKITNTNSKTSNLFWGDISKNKTFKKYKNAINNLSEDDVIDDILQQVYTNSKICTLKFNNYKIGIIFSSIGIVMLMVLIFLGHFIFV